MDRRRSTWWHLPSSPKRNIPPISQPLHQRIKYIRRLARTEPLGAARVAEACPRHARRHDVECDVVVLAATASTAAWATAARACQGVEHAADVQERRCLHVMAEEQRHDADGFAARAGLRLRRDVSVDAGAARIALVDEVDAERLTAVAGGDGDGGAVLREGGVVVGFLGAPGVVAEPVSNLLA